MNKRNKILLFILAVVTGSTGTLVATALFILGCLAFLTVGIIEEYGRRTRSCH